MSADGSAHSAGDSCAHRGPLSTARSFFKLAVSLRSTDLSVVDPRFQVAGQCPAFPFTFADTGPAHTVRG